MEKKQKIALAIGAGVLVIGVGVGLYFAFRDKTSTITAGEPGTSPELPPPTGTTLQDVLNNAAIIANQVSAFTAEKFPLRAGMKGPNVKLMQDALRTKFNQLNVKSDGLFGLKTFTALKNIGYATLANNTISKENFDLILTGAKKVTT